MAITRWHYGKLILLWTWGALAVVVLFYVATDLEPDGNDSVTSIFGLVMIVCMVAIPGALSVVTWKWLGGRERGMDDDPPSERGTA
jgi:hypothetical protein